MENKDKKENIENNENKENTTHKSKLITILIIIVLFIVGIFLYARYVGTTGVKIKENAVIDENLPATFNGFKIVQFADIHYGRTISIKDIDKIVKKINNLKPDIIIFTGDLFDKDIKVTEDDIDKLKDSFNKLDSSIDKYAVKGDNDYSDVTDFETIFKYADFKILDNSNDFIYYKDKTPIKIVGTTSNLKSKIDYDSAFDTFGDENEYYTILIAHEPNIIDIINNYKVNTIFTAHSLGGLINIPFVGGIIKYKGSDNYIEGYYKVNNIQMYVNSGLGTQDYDFRFNNRPSINLYRLYNY